MDQRVSFITLAVSDLAASRRGGYNPGEIGQSVLP